MIELRVTDLKQYVYCQRVVYFSYVLPVPKKVTYKMEMGTEEHVNLERLEQRRQFKKYKLQSAERRFRVPLYSERLGLSGVLDMLIIAGKDYIPVEFKYTRHGPGLNHKYQLMGYGMLLEDLVGRPLRGGFIYISETKDAYQVEFTQDMRDFVREMLSSIRRMIQEERMPPPTRQVARCTDCEYRRFCSDSG